MLRVMVGQSYLVLLGFFPFVAERFVEEGGFSNSKALMQ
jgi:hypothetical protein